MKTLKIWQKRLAGPVIQLIIRPTLSLVIAFSVLTPFLIPAFLNPVPALAQPASWIGKPISLGYLPCGFFPKPFKFILTTDSHFGSGQGNKNSSWALRDISQRHKDAAFLIHMGDITETGARAEYELFKKSTSALPYPILATMGNHEARWQDPQGAVFGSFFGPSTYSFDYGSWHFIVLNTTYPEQTLGTLDPQIVSWLEKDLALQAKGKPVAVFSHHPLLYEPKNFQDSDDAFLKLLDEYPIQVVFSGHGHSFIPWKVQGRNFFMIGALMDCAYAVVEVEGTQMTIYSAVKKEDNGTVFVQESFLGKVSAEPFENLKNPITEFSVKNQQGILKGNFTLRKEAFVFFQIDGGYYNALGKKPPGNHQFSVDISKHAKGIHTIRLKAVTSDGPYFSIQEFGKDEEDLVLWQAQFASALVGRILPKSSAQVIVGTRDGYIYCVRITDGQIIWKYDALSPWGGGVLDGSRLYLGTGNGELHCIDVEKGTLIWKRTLDPAGFVEPPTFYRSSKGKFLYLGSCSGKVYAINPLIGITQWSYEATGAVTNTPSAGRDLIFFGAWDGSFYALYAATGKDAWTSRLGRQIYYSPAVNSLYYRNTVFTSTPRDNHSGGSFVYALNPSDGKEMWRTVSWQSFIEPAAPQNSPTSSVKIAGRPFVLAPDSSGKITAIYVDTGEIAWSLQGSGTLFSGLSNLDSIYVTGGARGVLNIFQNKMKIDYKVRDTFLFTGPLVVKLPHDTSEGQGKYILLQGDARGTLWAITIPTQ